VESCSRQRHRKQIDQNFSVLARKTMLITFQVDWLLGNGGVSAFKSRRIVFLVTVFALMSTVDPLGAAVERPEHLHDVMLPGPGEFSLRHPQQLAVASK
jgi:hypothetical protein